MDLVICHDYGPFMLECNMQGGLVTWLENPGRAGLNDGHWKERYIGRWPAMHRLKAGFFTQKYVLGLLSVIFKLANDLDLILRLLLHLLFEENMTRQRQSQSSVSRSQRKSSKRMLGLIFYTDWRTNLEG